MAQKTIKLDDGTSLRCLEVSRLSVDPINGVTYTLPSQTVDALFFNGIEGSDTAIPNTDTTHTTTKDDKSITWTVQNSVEEGITTGGLFYVKQSYSDAGADVYKTFSIIVSDVSSYKYSKGAIFIAHYYDGEDKYYPFALTTSVNGFTFYGTDYTQESNGIVEFRIDTQDVRTLTQEPFLGVDPLDTSYINFGELAPTADPYERGGYSLPEGGNGQFDAESDKIGYSEQSLINADVNGTLVTLFHATKQQLSKLADYLWSADFLDQLTKIAQDPLDVILSVHIVPVRLATDGLVALQIGNVKTSVNFYLIHNQYVTLDMGAVDVQQYYNGALDFAPHTKIRIYLPYVGFRELDPDEVMGRRLGVQYKIDLLSGSFVCELLVDANVLYIYEGNCMQPIPITGRNYAEYYSSIINGITGTVGAIAGGAAVGGPVAAVAGGLAAGGSALWNAYNKSKGSYTHSGTVGGNHGLMTQQKPYLVYEIPRAVIPEGNQGYVGYPSNITDTLGNLQGWTVVRDIHLDGVVALSDELSELENLLREGVIF